MLASLLYVFECVINELIIFVCARHSMNQETAIVVGRAVPVTATATHGRIQFRIHQLLPLTNELPLNVLCVSGFSSLFYSYFAVALRMSSSLLF